MVGNKIGQIYMWKQKGDGIKIKIRELAKLISFLFFKTNSPCIPTNLLVSNSWKWNYSLIYHFIIFLYTRNLNPFNLLRK